MKVTEEFLHFIWKNKLFQQEKLYTSQNEKVEIINTGIHNFDAGPDFFNAKIKTGNTTWAGNVEIHINASDWISHKHHENMAYDNVILQAVYNRDTEIYRKDKSVIPTIELKFNNDYLKNYKTLLENQYWIACEKEIKNLDLFIIKHWLTNLTVERLTNKSDYIEKRLNSNNNHWEETFYQLIARSFGSKTNSDPFEWLAISLPMSVLAHYKNDLFQIEALLFGQAGFLSDQKDDEYYNSLKKEYGYLQKKHQLKPLQKHIWKFLRLRPLNFPTIRIAQFAGLIHKSSALFSKILESASIEELESLFNVEASGYWKNHYNFGTNTTEKTKSLGDYAIQSIFINTIIPFYFVYGEKKGNQFYKNKAIRFLEKLPPEKNSIISSWKDLGIIPENAFESQALLELKNNYCNRKNCLNCQIGNKIIIQ
ncbi:MAG: DUF2851 family protein [Bacteroidales bacterium]|nr:DUF2851 family protein [Bacteroidales bacterium]